MSTLKQAAAALFRGATKALAPRGALAGIRKLPVAKPVPGAPPRVPMRDTVGAPITTGGPKPSSLAQLVHRMQDTGAQYTGRGFPKGTRGPMPSTGLQQTPRAGVHPDVDPAFAPAPKGFQNTAARRASPADLARVHRAEWRSQNLPQWANKAYGAVTGLFKGASATNQSTESGLTPMAKTNSQDAFRLGCYAAAKHAGASHDEAIAFVADLDRQAIQQDAFRLGAFKVAKDRGASDEQALEFVGTVEKQAGMGQAIGGAAKAVKGFLSPTGLANKGADFVRNVGKGWAGKSPKGRQLQAPKGFKATADWMTANPKKTGVGLLGAGALAAPPAIRGVGSVLGFGGDKAKEEGAGGPGGLSQRDLMLMMMLSRQGQGGGDNPWLRAGAMPYYQ